MLCFLKCLFSLKKSNKKVLLLIYLYKTSYASVITVFVLFRLSLCFKFASFIVFLLFRKSFLNAIFTKLTSK